MPYGTPDHPISEQSTHPGFRHAERSPPHLIASQMRRTFHAVRATTAKLGLKNNKPTATTNLSAPNILRRCRTAQQKLKSHELKNTRMQPSLRTPLGANFPKYLGKGSLKQSAAVASPRRRVVVASIAVVPHPSCISLPWRSRACETSRAQINRQLVASCHPCGVGVVSDGAAGVAHAHRGRERTHVRKNMNQTIASATMASEVLATRRLRTVGPRSA